MGEEKINVSAIYNYDQILCGNETRFSGHFFEDKSVHGNNNTKETALSVLRYAIEDLLRWTPRVMVDYFDGEVINTMKLGRVIEALYKTVPVQLDKKKDYYWYAHLLYPDEIVINDEDLTIKTYRDLLNGKINKFTKGFLEGDEGEDRIRLCLLYYLSQYFPVSSIRELYARFATDGNKILKTAKLDGARRAHFEHPLDFLHSCLPSHQKDEFYYHYYKFEFYNRQSKDKANKGSRKRKNRGETLTGQTGVSKEEGGG